MSNENESKSPNIPPDEIGAAPNGTESTGPKKSGFSTVFTIFKNFLPAILAAFTMGKETFKRRVKGAPVADNPADTPPVDGLPGPGIPENESAANPLPQKPPGFFRPKLAAFKQKVSALSPFRKPAANEPGPAKGGEEDEHGEHEKRQEIAPAAGSKKLKFILAFLIIFIIIISVCGGLYLGGMFEKDTAAESGSPAVAAPPKNAAPAPKKSLFDSIFGKKDKEPATPQERLAAMRIPYNANNFVRYAGRNNMQVVELFIKAGMHPDIGRPVDGFTSLMAASAFGRPAIAEFLLEKGADINAQDKEGQTALMKAVRHNRPYLAEMLLKNKADPNIADNAGNTAITLAKEYYVDDRIAEVFANFGVNISDVKKTPKPEEALDSVLPPANRVPVPNPVPGPAPGAAPSPTKRSPYLEISVMDFLRMLEPKPVSEPDPNPMQSQD